MMPLIPLNDAVLSPVQIESYRRYDSCIARVARRTGASLVALGEASRLEGEPFWPDSMSADDGVHLTALGQAWLAAKVSAHINTAEPAHNLERPSTTGKDAS